MREFASSSEGVFKPADSHESADTLKENQSPKPFVQVNISSKQQVFQAKVELQEKQNAEIELDSKLDFFKSMSGEELSLKEKAKYVEKYQENKENISVEEQIKAANDELRVSGKSIISTLQELIEHFEGENGVKNWVENWKQFLKLHAFAQDKPHNEKADIENIILNADYTSDTGFEEALSSLQKSTNISDQTKLEIAQRFGGATVKSVTQMDANLNRIKVDQERLKSRIKDERKRQYSLKSDLDSLEKTYSTLPLGDPERTEIEEEIEATKLALSQSEKDISKLQIATEKEVSFSLREGITARQNGDGSRSIVIDLDGFELRLPSHRVPLSNTKNVRTVNLVFPFRVLRDLGIADTVLGDFLPNGSIPTKSQRKRGHLILSELGFNDAQILSQSDINQLTSDLTRFNSKAPIRTPKEVLTDIGVIDPIKDSLDVERLRTVLRFIREQRDLPTKVFWEQLDMRFEVDR